MDYVRLGRTGLQVSRICLGCMSYGQATTGMHHWPWTLSEHDGRTFIKRAVDLGVNFFDTANNYSDGESEAVLGRAIRDFAHRDEVVLADHRPLLLEARKAALAKLLKKVTRGIHLVEHMTGDGATIFAQACKLGFEGIVSKHREHPYRSGPSKAWVKVKNPVAPGVVRFEDRS